MLCVPGRAVATQHRSRPDSVWRPGQSETPATPCVRWPGSVGDLPRLCAAWVCRFCPVSDHTGALCSEPPSALPRGTGLYSRGFEAALTEVSFHPQDGRNPSSEWQRRASPATCRNNRYPSVLQVGNSAIVYPLSVLHLF